MCSQLPTDDPCYVDELVNRGIVETHLVPRARTLERPPTTFYSVTGEGSDLLMAVSMYEAAAVWRSVDDRMGRTDRTDAIEDLSTRPEVGCEGRCGTADAYPSTRHSTTLPVASRGSTRPSYSFSRLTTCSLTK